MTTTASPAAKSRPAVIAAWWPKFRLKPSTFIRGSNSAAAGEDRSASRRGCRRR